MKDDETTTWECGNDGLGNPAGSPADHTTYYDDAEGSAAPWKFLDELHCTSCVFSTNLTNSAGIHEHITGHTIVPADLT